MQTQDTMTVAFMPFFMNYLNTSESTQWVTLRDCSVLRGGPECFIWTHGSLAVCPGLSTDTLRR